jgi:MoaE-MoaD fusion protein
MQVRVLFFGVLKDLTGRGSDVLSLPDHATAADVVNHYAQRMAGTPQLFKSIAISVNQEYARPEDRLRAGDEVALLPPVSGGFDPSRPNSAKAFITREKIDSAATLDLIKRPEDGAVVLFEGIVRNHSRGRHTLYLDYEAYEEMALKQMESLIAQATQQFQIRDAIILHRLGRLQIGETSVLIVVAAAHRSAAFEASRWLIDNLKRTVPIWKKEHFEDGAIWSDGEPFPQELSSTTVVEARASASVTDQEADVGRRKPVLSEVEGAPPVPDPVQISPMQQKSGTNPENPASNPIVHK